LADRIFTREKNSGSEFTGVSANDDYIMPELNLYPRSNTGVSANDDYIMPELNLYPRSNVRMKWYSCLHYNDCKRTLDSFLYRNIFW